MKWRGNSYRFSSYDSDALAWIGAIEAADGQSLESAVRDAYNAFVVGLKSDGIFSALQLLVILAGARTQAGALRPLVGPSQTAISLPTGGYARKTGQLGDGTGYIDSGFRLNQLTMNNAHMALWAEAAATSGVGYMGRDDNSATTGEMAIYRNSATFVGRCQNSTAFTSTKASSSTGFIGMSRSSSTSISFRAAGATESLSNNSAGAATAASNILVFSRDTAAASKTNGRILFYSAGRNLTLATLEARVATLRTALNSAIP